MDEKEQIRELYRNYWRYMIDKNADGLRGLMASTGWGLARALDALGVPQDERDTLVAELGAAT